MSKSAFNIKSAQKKILNLALFLFIALTLIINTAINAVAIQPPTQNFDELDQSDTDQHSLDLEEIEMLLDELEQELEELGSEEQGFNEQDAESEETGSVDLNFDELEKQETADEQGLEESDLFSEGIDPEAFAEMSQELLEIQPRSMMMHSAPVRQPFLDVNQSHQFFNEILWMYSSGISTGTLVGNGNAEYKPTNSLSRAAMAAFMFRMFAPQNYKAPKNSPFSDVSKNHQFYKEISWMHSSGLSTGWTVGKKQEYRPERSITRHAMAAFLFRQIETNKNWKAKQLPFTDVSATKQFSKEISWMFETGRSTGYFNEKNGTREFKPSNNLSRAATAAFLYRAIHPQNPPKIAQMSGSIKISGTAKVGDKLTVNTSSWKPTNTSLKYQWLLDGKNISGATKNTYTPIATHLNKNISVKITSSKPGYQTKTATSASVKITKSVVTAKDFVAGNIISDAKMFDGNAMTVKEIQDFLEHKMPNCIIGTTGYKAGSKYGNTKIAKSCLPQMRFDSAGDVANNQCSTYAPKKNETAAEIIHKVGKACGVSQKVLLVMLQKEQGLILDNWPVESQYDWAMGYGCPDTGPNFTANCGGYIGFYEQVSWAGYQLKLYKNRPEWYNHRAQKASVVQYHPQPKCGTKTIKMANAATAALYNYTPYTPDSAAINAGYNAGGACSAYGNRNFFLFYNDWFGSSK